MIRLIPVRITQRYIVCSYFRNPFLFLLYHKLIPNIIFNLIFSHCLIFDNCHFLNHFYYVYFNFIIRNHVSSNNRTLRTLLLPFNAWKQCFALNLGVLAQIDVFKLANIKLRMIANMIFQSQMLLERMIQVLLFYGR